MKEQPGGTKRCCPYIEGGVFGGTLGWQCRQRDPIAPFSGVVCVIGNLILFWRLDLCITIVPLSPSLNLSAAISGAEDGAGSDLSSPSPLLLPSLSSWPCYRFVRATALILGIA